MLEMIYPDFLCSSIDKKKAGNFVSKKFCIYCEDVGEILMSELGKQNSYAFSISNVNYFNLTPGYSQTYKIYHCFIT